MTYFKSKCKSMKSLIIVIIKMIQTEVVSFGILRLK